MKHFSGQSRRPRVSPLHLTYAAVIAALYVLLTVLSQAAGLASGVIQFRLSECLTVLPAFTGTAIPGLAVGCFLAGLLCAAPPVDLVVGTLATAVGAVGTYLLRRKKVLAPLPPILSNALILPPVIAYCYGAEQAYWFLFLTVGAGELLCCGVLGGALTALLEKHPSLFRHQ